MITFVGSNDLVEQLEPDEDPTDLFPCMSCRQFHREARAQLYSLVTGQFLDDASQLEELHRSLSDDGPWIYRLDADLQSRLADLDEDRIEELAALWMDCEEVESLEADLDDVHEFMYQLVHFCRVACDDEDLSVFVYAGG